MPALNTEFLYIQENYGVWIHSKTHTWGDNNIQSRCEVCSKLTIKKHFAFFESIRYFLYGENLKLFLHKKAPSELTESSVVTAWFRFAEVRFQPVQSGQISPYDYMGNLNFISARRDSFSPGISLDLYMFSFTFLCKHVSLRKSIDSQ